MPEVLFIGLNHDQIPYLKAFRDLGYSVIGLDMNALAPGVHLVDFFVNQGYENYDEIEAILAAEPRLQPDAVFTAAAQFSHVVAARVAALYGIRYPSEELIKKLLDKSQFYPMFEQHGLPIPKSRYFYEDAALKGALTHAGETEKFYIKSDFSKNPLYVYYGTAKELRETKIHWNADTHFRSSYVMQPEVIGTSLRINIFAGGFEVYDFKSGNELTKISDNILSIAYQLQNFCQTIGLGNWIVKFDVIDTGESFATLDIGIDPPARMVKKYERNGQDFAKFYVGMYLNALTSAQ